jgi:hypothetical protein
MQMDSKVKDIINRVSDGLALGKDEILFLLKIDHRSMEAGLIMAAANEIARTASKVRLRSMLRSGSIFLPVRITVHFVPLAHEIKFLTKKRN